MSSLKTGGASVASNGCAEGAKSPVYKDSLPTQKEAIRMTTNRFTSLTRMLGALPPRGTGELDPAALEELGRRKLAACRARGPEVCPPGVFDYIAPE